MKAFKRSLTTRLASRMSLAALGGVAITFLGSLLVYGLIPGEAFVFEARDYVVLLVFCVLGGLLGGIIAQPLARQLARPIRSVADAARRIAANDLAARAEEPGRGLPGELRELAADFNLMAGRLERLAGERRQMREAISHEIRTPLMILRGQLQGGLDGVYALDARLLESALGQVETLARTIEDLKAMEVTEDHFIRREEFALDKVLEELRTIMGGPLERAGFSVDWRIAPAPVFADQARLRQAAVSILQNLLLHATPGPARVILANEGGEVLFSVSDAGPGIPAQLRETVFEPFKRGPTAAKGSGVGLALVRYTVDAHGGRAVIGESDLGGCDVQIRMPIGRQQRVSAREEQAP